MAVQHYKLCKQVESLQVSCHLHPPLWLWNMDPACWLKKRIQAIKTKCIRKLLCISYLEHKTNDRVQSKTNFLVGPQESSGNCQEMESCMVQACHTPQKLPQNHPSGHLGGWAMLWSTKEMLDGQHQRIHPCPCHNCSQGPPAEKTGKGPLLNCPWWPSQGTELYVWQCLIVDHNVSFIRSALHFYPPPRHVIDAEGRINNVSL